MSALEQGGSEPTAHSNVRASASSSSPLSARKRRRKSGKFDGWAVSFVVSPKSSFQVAIWEKSLSGPAMGAVIVPHPSSAPQTARNIVVVTDKESGARAHACAAAAGRPAYVVGKEWCVRSLGRGEPLNPSSFRVPRQPKPNSGQGFSKSCPAGQGPQEPAGARLGGQPPDWTRYEWLSGSALRSVWNPCRDLSPARKNEIVRLVPKCGLMRARCNPELIPNPNDGLVKALRRIAKKRALMLEPDEGDKKSLIYNRAASAIAVLPFTVTSADDVSRLSGMSASASASANSPAMSDGVRAKIAEYCLSGGHVAELAEFESNGALVLAEELVPVYGISLKRIRELWQDGVRSVDDVLNYFRESGSSASPSASLTRKALDAHVDQSGPLSQSEARALQARVVDYVRRSFPSRSFTVKLCGGFRRGNSVGHDGLLTFSWDA